MDIAVKVTYLLTAFFDAFLVSTLCNSILRRKKSVTFIRIAIYLVFPIFLFVMNLLISSNNLRLFVITAFVFLLALICFSGKLINKVYVAALLTAVTLVGDIVSWGIVLLFFPEYISEGTSNTPLVFLFGVGASYVYIFVTILIFRLFPKQYFGDLTKSQGLLLTLMPLSGSIAIILFQDYLIKQKSGDYYMYLVPAIFFLGLLFFVMMFFRELQRSNENASVSAVLNRQLENFDKQYNILEAEYQSLRELRHDWRHHITVIVEAINREDYESLKSYIQEPQFTFDKEFVILGDSIIDMILNTMKSRAEKAGISFEISSKLPHPVQINRADLCVLISNATENAYEACLKSDEMNKRISVNFVTDDTYFFFLIKNTIVSPPHKVGDRFITSKADDEMHGIGLLSIERIINKHAGHLKITTDNNVFSLRCVLENK